MIAVWTWHSHHWSFGILINTPFWGIVVVDGYKTTIIHIRLTLNPFIFVFKYLTY